MRTTSNLFLRMSRRAAVLAGLCLAGHAIAAGPFDGIYQLAGTEEFYSVHQNGSRMIVGNFIVGRFPIAMLLTNGQQFNATRLDYWNLFSGPISGSVAQLQGEAVFGACFLSATANFTQAGATVTVNSVSQTLAGSGQGTNCAAVLPPAGLSFGLVKVF